MRAEILNTRDRRIVTDVKKLIRRVGRDFRLGRTIVNVVFVNNRKMRELNRRHLKRNRPTDVLAFPLDIVDLENSTKVLGEVYVSRDQARVQAREHRVGYYDEIQRLVLHGVFHLLGLSHEEMEACYVRYL